MKNKAALFVTALLFVCPFAVWSQDVTAEPESLTFCSYNLKNWLTSSTFEGDKVVKGTSKPAGEKEGIVSILNAIRPDVLGVCEIGGEADLKDLQKRLRAIGLELPNMAYAHGGDPTRKLGLLTRFAIMAENHQTNLTYRIGDMRLPMQRGILDATVRVTDSFSLHCVGVHLKSMRPVPDADQALMRRNEAHLLRQHLDKILRDAPETNLLLYGDFNERRNQASLDEILGPTGTDLSLNEVPLADRNGEVWTHYWDNAGEYSRIDYFFVSTPLRPHIDFTRSFIFSKHDFDKASDHRPIVMRISLKPPRK